MRIPDRSKSWLTHIFKGRHSCIMQLLFAWCGHLPSIVNVDVVISQLWPSLLQVQSDLVVLNQRCWICLIFGVEALEEFNKFRISVVCPGCCWRFGRSLIRHELGAWSVMMMPLNGHFFFVFDILLVNDQWPSSLIVLTIKSIVWILECIRVIEVPRLNLPSFNVLLQLLHGLTNLVRWFQWKCTLCG